MTSEEYDKLTDEEKQIKVAELDGWEKFKLLDDLWHKQGELCVPTSGLPDYLNDLNAMHEAEKGMERKHSLQEKYLLKLSILTGNEQLDNFRERWHVAIATAEQRAKAFVLTLSNSY